MKKIIFLMLAAVMLLSSCSKKAEKDVELGGVMKYDLLYIDFDDPTIDAELVEKEVTLSNGETDTSYMRVPMLNVDLTGAQELSQLVADSIHDSYDDYFDDPTDKIVKVDYYTEDSQDILALFITVYEKSPDKECDLIYPYYYDSLADCELDLVTYASTCGVEISGIYDAIMETDWAKEYEKEAGEEPDDEVILALKFVGENLFDVYCLNAGGKDYTKLTLEVESATLDFSQLEEWSEMYGS